jgi:hypothetical protein
MRRGTPRRSEQNQSLDEEIGKIPEQLPNRFVFVYTPKHGSWLNLAENLFGKMARTFLKHIRVQSWEELKERILRGINEINAQPVVFRWTKFSKTER